MLNEQKIAEIRKKIQDSTILNDHEKSDWLNLLELMNDKQLGELEEILATEVRPQPVMAPIQASTPTPAPAPPTLAATPVTAPLAPPAVMADKSPPDKKMPPLSHISNMPTDLNMTHSVPPRPAPHAPSPAPQPQPRPQPLQKPRPVSPVQPFRPSKPKLPFELERAEDLENLEINDLRSFDFHSISNAIKASIAEHGYYPVLQLIEASPLYDSYLLTGEDQLNGQASSDIDDPKRLSQEEMEFMTDLLSNMRFNRL